MLNIAVFISGGGTNLQAIINAVKENKINGKIKLVFSNRKNAYGLIRAQNESIDTFYLNRKKFFCNEEYDERILEELERKNIDLIVLAGYLNILSSKLVSKYSNRIINIHPSLLPKYGGKGMYGIKVHAAIIANKEKESGCTIHFVDNGIDTGEIITNVKVPVYEDDTPEILQKRVLEKEHILLIEGIKKLLGQ